MARLKAEAEAEHATRRLAVAQEQIAEYAQQREGEAGSLLSEVQAVDRALASALASSAAGTPEAGPSGGALSSSSSSSLAELSAHVQASCWTCMPLHGCIAIAQVGLSTSTAHMRKR